MVFRVPVLDSSGAGTRITLAVNDALEVGPGIQLITTDTAPAVDAVGGLNEITVFGRISSAGVGIRTTATVLQPTLVEIETGGLVSGSTALQAGGGMELTNRGTMLGSSVGVELNCEFTAGQRVVNHGRIVGGLVGIGLASDGSPPPAAKTSAAAVSGTVFLENYGTIRGGDAALDLVYTSGLIDFDIFNQGSMRGGVLLGAGDDTFRNSGTILGAVDMGAGTDTYHTSVRAETVQGGSGTDTVTYSSLGAAVLTLDATTGSGGSATGDRMLGFEKVFGSLTGSDNLTGNGLANTLLGQGGNDSLQGAGGNDTLNGSSGNDVLTGGTGNDVMLGGTGDDLYFVDSLGDVVTEGTAAGVDKIGTAVSLTLGANIEDGFVTTVAGQALTGNAFANRLTGGNGADTLNGGAGIDTLFGGNGADHFRFTHKTDAGDQISDFTSGVDKISIDISAFAVALPAGVVAASRLQVRADNVAQDSDDRFIFRTTDKTLWLDANGNLSGALTLIADFQATATFTANDFALF